MVTFFRTSYLKIFSILILGIILSLATMANKNGRAASQGKGNTGAPGDELNTNGTPKTCVNCHNAGPITATMGITLLELDGDTVTTYLPNTDYILRVNMDGVGTSLQGYGFQMIGLRNSNNTDVKGMSDFGGVSANNYKISTIQNGRTYAEHSNTSAKDTFNVRWKSPVAGTGAITFYASGNAVNGNNGTGGDGAATATLVLTEGQASSTDEMELGAPTQVQISPNPVHDEGVLRFKLNQAGNQEVQVFDLMGKSVWSTQQWMSSGEQQIRIPMGQYSPGLYFIRVSDGKTAISVKVLKI